VNYVRRNVFFRRGEPSPRTPAAYRGEPSPRTPAAGRGKVVAAGLAGTLALGAAAALGAGALPASAAATSHARAAAGDPTEIASTNPNAYGELRSPPKPPSGHPVEPSDYKAPKAVIRKLDGALTSKGAQVTPPSEAKTWGASGAATTLVLYDTTNTYGWLGELYAIGAGNLATHFGTVTAEPVVDYVAGQVNDYTATIYLGSTYNEPIPAAFLNDVLTTTHQVVWVGDNIWQLSGTEGSTTDEDFQANYGWDPALSYFDTVDNVASVTYKSQEFTRSLANTAGILAPDVTNASAVSVLATANCSDSSGNPLACNEIAQVNDATSFPWALHSGNLMYIGEIPFSYMTPTDRYIAFSDLLFDAIDPTATASHLALVRLEDISAESSPADLEEFAAYLKSVNVPFSMAVIPQYLDPNGFYNNGVPVSESLSQSTAMVAALKVAVADGGTIVQHGYTHQYSNVDNPYDGVTADDFEFYRAQCAPTDTPPYTFATGTCPNTDYVIETGPLPGDSQAWAESRVLTGRAQFALAGLPTPTIWTTPHYAASAVDYAGIDQVYSTRYEQELFFGGELTGGAIDYSHVFGQYFPYEVHDLYGSTIIPENLNDYEPTEQNNNPPRTAQDIINEAQLNSAVTQGVASFFIHSDYDPLSALEQIVQGIQAEGYTFVSPATLMADNG
jgi:uncharacterized protein YdaL